MVLMDMRQNEEALKHFRTRSGADPRGKYGHRWRAISYKCGIGVAAVPAIDGLQRPPVAR